MSTLHPRCFSYFSDYRIYPYALSPALSSQRTLLDDQARSLLCITSAPPSLQRWETILPAQPVFPHPGVTSITSITSIITIKPTVSLKSISPRPRSLKPKIASSPRFSQPAKKVKKANRTLQIFLRSFLQGSLQVGLGSVVGALLVLRWAPVPGLPQSQSLGGSEPEGETLLGSRPLTKNLNLAVAAPITTPQHTGQISATPHPASEQSATPAALPSSLGMAPNPAMVVVDRFYLAHPASTSQTQNPTIVAVDRYYVPDSASSGSLSQVWGSPAGSDPSSPHSAQPMVQSTGSKALYTIRDRDLPATPVAPTEPDFALAPLPPEAQISPRLEYKLLGVLELDQHPTALFDTGNTTISIQMGEEIGRSNWTLSSLKDGKALLQKGTQTLLLSVGESF